MAGLPLVSVPAARARWAPWFAAPAAAVLSIGACYVHLAYAQDHWRDWWAYGLFFLAVGALQLLFALLVLRWPRPGVALAGIAANLAVVGMYTYSRTVGIPLGPHARVKELAGAVDLTTTASEIVIVALLLTLVGARARRWTVNLLLIAGAVLWVLRFTVGSA
jgi:hypothetical protein